MGWVSGRWPDMVGKVEAMETRFIASTRDRLARLSGLLRRR
jgi:hypothetical protein